MTVTAARDAVETDVDLDRATREFRLPATVGGHFYRFVSTEWAWLVPVLILQGGLAVRVNGPIATDEATYVVAGHQLIGNFLHGTYVQDYGTYFSGVPGLYPVLAAAIDDVLGITGVRMLSLVCLLVTNVCLFAVARRLFGSRAATFASFVFAVSSGATFLAWYATFDGLSLMLLAIATLMAFRAAERPGRPGRRLVVAIGPVLVAAVAVKYVAIVYVPTILILVALAALRLSAWSVALRRLGVACASTLVSAGLCYLLTSPSDVTGFFATSSSGRRVLEAESRLHLLALSWSFVGPSLLLALVGLCVLFAQRRDRVITSLLLVTGVLPVITQVVLGESTSLHKHTAFGLFFAAPLAGFAIARGLAFGRAHLEANRSPVASPDLAYARANSVRRSLVPVVVIGWVTCLLGTGMSSVEAMRYGWPDSPAVVTALAPYVTSSGNYLADNPSIPSYAFRDGTSPQQWSAPWFFQRRDGHSHLSGDPALLSAIQHDFFTAIVYRPQTFTASQQAMLMPAITEHYRLVEQLPYGRDQAWYLWVPIT